ncbi:MAG: ABC transporter ATP-binding protein [Clostridiaceae bacterium]|nr:ABC transporter ATP-binding protein [Clostridiaceae bacterium]
MFKFKNVNLVYDLGKEDTTYALRNINFSHENKGLLGIIGPSGSGKSSLLYLMSGLKTATSGEVFYKGRELGKLTSDERARLRHKEFGFVFQRGYLLEYLSVLDNVLVPVNVASEEARKKALILLERLEIEKLAAKKPYQLSGGQRQRVTIARALISDPEIIFADEPTAALDHKTAFQVMSLFSEISKDKLVVVVTHDKSILNKNCEVIGIWDGEIDTSKTQDEFKFNKELVKLR